MKTIFPVLLLVTASFASALAADSATIQVRGNRWTLSGETLQATVAFVDGSIRLDRFYNREAKAEYLTGKNRLALFKHQIDGATVAANDGGWKLTGADIGDIKLFGVAWGKRLEITLSRTAPVSFTTRQVFEIYNGQAALRYGSFVRNDTDKELTISASDVLALDLPDKPHQLFHVPCMYRWEVTTGGLTRGGRDGIVRYDCGDGWFVVPENNWATSLKEGQQTGDPNEKFLRLDIWNGVSVARVATNPKAVHLTLFPLEELEYFSVNIGVFKGDGLDGRVAVAEHLRKRFKFVNTAPTLSLNDWHWGQNQHRRTEANFRNIVISKAASAGFDRIHFDASWYKPDSAEAWEWTPDMTALCDQIVASGMKPGHWFPLQGKGGNGVWDWSCWYSGHGRDAADPANIDFKLKQTEEVLIGKYHTRWGQLDCGLLWRNDEVKPYSHPNDSVYRKLLGMRRYVNAITHQYPDFIMHVTCEIDNPSGGRDGIGLAHLGDNAVIGSFCRTENKDDVRDLFDSVGSLPIEGQLSTPGDNGRSGWQDSPLWYYQLLIARHSSTYAWPGYWLPQSVAHMRVFNDWRKSPRVHALLSTMLRPVYNGKDWLKNEGPWAWMFVDEARSQALLIALNHLKLAKSNVFAVKLRWIDPTKTYLVEDITMLPGGKFNHAFRGQFGGAKLQTDGLPIDLDASVEPCAAFWIQEKTSTTGSTP